MTLADSVLRDKTKEFAKKIVFLCRDMKSNHKESVLINQLLRSATSIGANLHEAKYAQSRADFINKLEIALKECAESEYWIEILTRKQKLTNDQSKLLKQKSGAIRRKLIASITTAKSSNS